MSSTWRSSSLGPPLAKGGCRCIPGRKCSTPPSPKPGPVVPGIGCRAACHPGARHWALRGRVRGRHLGRVGERAGRRPQHATDSTAGAIDTQPVRRGAKREAVAATTRASKSLAACARSCSMPKASLGPSRPGWPGCRTRWGPVRCWFGAGRDPSARHNCSRNGATVVVKDPSWAPPPRHGACRWRSCVGRPAQRASPRRRAAGPSNARLPAWASTGASPDVMTKAIHATAKPGCKPVAAI